jgi:Mlc titration factor MtfA (ptsG expression regulator)
MWSQLAQWLRHRLPGRKDHPPRHVLPSTLWHECLKTYPFLQALSAEDQARLSELSALFLEEKEFHGAHGLVVTDSMAVQIAAQACLPLLHLDSSHRPLAWYDDFVGIVVHRGEVRARRTVEDELGIVHEYDEVLVGEAMQGGPVMLSWSDVQASSTETGYNVVIHEFAHKLDLRDGEADGCPPLPAGFLGASDLRSAREKWDAAMQPAYESFREAAICAERFSAEATWLDPYAAQDLAEFFAVTSEAYFVNRPRFAQEFEALCGLYNAWYGTPPHFGGGGASAAQQSL